MNRPLHIADPCSERWEAMPGSAAQRRCDRCEKQVHSLSDMTRAEAERLLSSARPGSLCVRVEHDEAGVVRFRSEAASSGGRAHPILKVAAGASLLVASCGQPGPAGEAAPPAATAEAPAATAESPAATAEAPAAGGPSAEPTAPAAGSAACAPQVGAQPAASAKVQPGQAGSGTRVTMGCMCAPGDALCDCL